MQLIQIMDVLKLLNSEIIYTSSFYNAPTVNNIERNKRWRSNLCN